MDWLNLKSRAGEYFKRFRYVFLILLFGILLMLIPDNSENTSEASVQIAENTQQELTLQDSLENLLCQIEGAGKAKVLLTISAGERTVYQSDEDASTSDSSSNVRTETVVLTDRSMGDYGLVQQVMSPIYQGAVILCQGAESPAVRLSIVEAVSDATGLTSDNITVLKMK